MIIRTITTSPAHHERGEKKIRERSIYQTPDSPEGEESKKKSLGKGRRKRGRCRSIPLQLVQSSSDKDRKTIMRGRRGKRLDRRGGGGRDQAGRPDNPYPNNSLAAERSSKQKGRFWQERGGGEKGRGLLLIVLHAFLQKLPAPSG